MIPCRVFISVKFLASACLAATMILAGASTAEAQAIAAVERQLLPFRTDLLSSIQPAFWDSLTFLRAEEDQQRSLKADITFGLSGDEAGERSLFKLNTGISLSRGVFPSEVSVVSKLGLQMRDGQLQEDVTTLQITYDYHTTHHVEYFAFAERFTDSFLSIQQRYEIGFGARAGLHIGRSGSWRTTDAHFAQIETSLPDVQSRMLGVQSGRYAGLPTLTNADVTRFRGAVEDLQHAIRDRQARLFIGVVASVFAEIERADLEVVSSAIVPSVAAEDAPVTSKVSLPAEQRYRLNLRPTIRFRPSAEVQITVHPYFKLPLDGPRYRSLPDGTEKLDYRRDVLSEMTWTIKQEQTGLENVDLVFTFNHFFDNAPPSLPGALVSAAMDAGRVFDRTVAEHSHSVVALSLKLKW